MALNPFKDSVLPFSFLFALKGCLMKWKTLPANGIGTK